MSKSLFACLPFILLSSFVVGCSQDEDVSESQGDTCGGGGCDDTAIVDSDLPDTRKPDSGADTIDSTVATDTADSGVGDTSDAADGADTKVGDAGDASDASDADGVVADTTDAADTTDTADTTPAVDTTIASVITVTATDASLADPSDTGTFVVSRGAATTPAITVSLAVDATSTVTTTTGGAIPVDYTVSGTGVTQTGTSITVVIPAGVSSVTVTVTPSANTHAEFAESLVVKAVAGTGYTVGAPFTANLAFAAHGLGLLSFTDVASGAALEGTLRQALTNANVTGGTITLGAGTITLVTSLPLMDGATPVVVNGAGAASSIVSCGGGAFRGIETRGTITFSGLTIQSCIDAVIGGAILNRGHITLNNCTLKNNSASRGAALDSFVATGVNVAIISGCTFSGNTGGTAIENSFGTLTVGGTTFTGNTGGDVSGACTNGGTANTPATSCP